MVLNLKQGSSSDKKLQQHILCVKIVMRPKSQSLALKIKHMVIEEKNLSSKILIGMRIDKIFK